MTFKQLGSFLDACFKEGVIVPEGLTVGINSEDFDSHVPEDRRELPDLEYNHRPKTDKNHVIRIKIVKLKN